MIYAVIDKNKGDSAGFLMITHNTYGDKMIVNENELRLRGDDTSAVAKSLDGELMSYGQLQEWIRKHYTDKI